MKTTLKNLAVKITAKLLQQPTIEQQLNDIQLSQSLPELTNIASPYFQLASDSNAATSERDDIVFITSRFRSGSTLLWNLFRKTPHCTAYYEPFNERQWFNKKMRGGNVDTRIRQPKRIESNVR